MTEVTWFCMRCMKSHLVIDGIVQCNVVFKAPVLTKKDWDVMIIWLRSLDDWIDHEPS